jgi:U3 small nucleolar RNA-associated protein 21
MHNLRFDETIMELVNASGLGTNADLYLPNTAARAARTAAGGACTALSFRTGAGVPLLAAGGGAGVVTVWNLEAQRLHTVLRDAHDAHIVALHFFAGEPVLMSSGADNALKQWIFDGPDGSARLLRFRSGHSAPPTVVRHYGDGKRLLSAGQDRAFRLFSTIQDAQSRELSQNHTQRRAKRLKVEERELKLARIVALDACDVRERDWSNVITAHEGDSNAYVWRLQRFALGEHVLAPPPKELLPGRPAAAAVTSVALSRCGNFGFVGSSAGRVDRYNMQSGMHRGSYRHGGPTCVTGRGATAHQGAVTGIASDACNRLVVTTGLDGWVRMWDFKTRELMGEVKAGSAIAKIAHHPGSGLLAAACDDLTIRMYDVEARRLVRRFKGHSDRVTDLQLSEDCRWLVSAGMDNTVRVWDVPGERLV